MDLVPKRRRVRLTAFPPLAIAIQRFEFSSTLFRALFTARDARLREERPLSFHSRFHTFARRAWPGAANRRFNAIYFFNDAEHRRETSKFAVRDSNGFTIANINRARY